MTDTHDLTRLVDAPLTFCEVERTPGFQHIRVVDLDTMTVLEDVTRVDTKAGIAWRWLPDFSRSHEWSGRYKLMCPPEVLQQFKEVWKACI
jgi:hypothetical protein